MAWRAALVAILMVAAAAMVTGDASGSPNAEPTPSFDVNGTALTGPGSMLTGGPGCPYAGGFTEFTGPDGTRYAHISQINIITSPCPSATPLPTAAPTPSPSPTPAPVVTKVDDAAFTYFGAAAGIAPATTTAWTAYPLDTFNKYGVGDHASGVTNAAFGFIFTGTEVRLFSAVAPYHGIAAVSLDGSAAVDVDFYSSTRMDQAPVYYSGALAPGIHRIIVKVTGRKNAASTDVGITADRADITGGTIIPPLSK